MMTMEPLLPRFTLRMLYLAQMLMDVGVRWHILGCTCGVAMFMSDKRSPDPGVPSDTAVGSLYVLWTAQLIGQVDIDTIAEFRQAASAFRPVPASATSNEPLYCRYMLIRKSDGGLISGNDARAIIGWDLLPAAPAGLSATAARDREIAHDDAQFLVRAPHETHMAMAARLSDYFVCVRCASQYFSIRFGAVVITVGVRPRGSAPPAPAPAPPSLPGLHAPAVDQQQGDDEGYPFLAALEDDCTLVTIAEALPTGGYCIREEAPAPAEVRLAEAGFFTLEGTNAASIPMPVDQVVTMLTSWGWTQIGEEDLLG